LAHQIVVLLQVLCNGLRSVFLSKNRSPNQNRWTPLKGSLSKYLLRLSRPIHTWAHIYYVFPSFPFKGPHKLRHI
jgi:hypothetical protein